MAADPPASVWSRRPATSVRKSTARRLRGDLSPLEVRVWNWLREHLHPAGWKFRRQVRIGPYVVDFASLRPKIALEIDGDEHETDEGRRRDGERDIYLSAQGFAVIRFSNSEVGSDGDAFTDALLGEIAKVGVFLPGPLERGALDPSPQGKVDGRRPAGRGRPSTNGDEVRLMRPDSESDASAENEAGGTGLAARCNPTPGFAGPAPEGRDHEDGKREP